MTPLKVSIAATAAFSAPWTALTVASSRFASYSAFATVWFRSRRRFLIRVLALARLAWEKG